MIKRYTQIILLASFIVITGTGDPKVRKRLFETVKTIAKSGMDE